jgi:hypothetical protein
MNIISAFLFSLFFCAHLIAMESERLLIVGCHPHDDNIKGVQGLDDAFFLDMHNPATEPIENFFHYNVNNASSEFTEAAWRDAGNFSDFARNNKNEFKTIVIDWATYQHFRRPDAWIDFFSILNMKGQIIIPVNYGRFTVKGYVNLSKSKAEEFVEKELSSLSNNIKIYSFDDLPKDDVYNLLRRRISSEGVIIVAQKTHDLV